MKRLEKITRELVEDLRADARATCADAAAMARRVNCLIVEDNDMDAALSMEAVGSVGGVTATLARSGDEALDLLREHHDFDIAFIDLKLVGSRAQGIDLISNIQNQFPKTHIIIVTGTIDKGTTEFMASEQQRGSYVGIVHKPLMRDNLEEILGKHRMKPQS